MTAAEADISRARSSPRNFPCRITFRGKSNSRTDRSRPVAELVLRGSARNSVLRPLHALRHSVKCRCDLFRFAVRPVSTFRTQAEARLAIFEFIVAIPRSAISLRRPLNVNRSTTWRCNDRAEDTFQGVPQVWVGSRSRLLEQPGGSLFDHHQRFT